MSKKEPRNKSFNLNSKKIFITIKSWIDNGYIEFINRKYPIAKWIFCNETGKKDSDHPYKHSHIAIVFKKTISIKNPRVFDYKGLHPCIESCRNWAAAVNYCKKEAGKHGNPDPNWVESEPMNDIGQMVKTITSSKNIEEAITKTATKISDFGSIIQLYKNKSIEIDEELVKELSELKYLNWHSDIINIISQDKNKRSIYWIVGEKGGEGKTNFCKKFRFEHLNECIIITTSGSTRDIGDVIRNWISTGGKPRYIIFDLPRTFVDKSSIYTVLESVKNGCLTCTKYSGTTIEFATPKVIVFSNWFPNTSGLSTDRWRIFTLEPNTDGDFDLTKSYKESNKVEYDHDSDIDLDAEIIKNINLA